MRRPLPRTIAQPPNELAPPRVGNPSRVAAGLPGVIESMRHAVRQMGPVRGVRTLLRANQDGGFDCPSCAWPEPADRSAFEFCENGAKAVASEATTHKAGPAVFATHSVEALGRMSDLQLNELGRLVCPLVKRRGSAHYEPIPWDEAYAAVAAAIAELDSPDAAAFYTSGRTSNEAAFLYQLLDRKSVV